MVSGAMNLSIFSWFTQSQIHFDFLRLFFQCQNDDELSVDYII